MALNLEKVGTTLAAVPFAYDVDTVILHALGIGLGGDEAELGFVYEKGLRVFPSFAALPFIRLFMDDFVPLAGIDLRYLLHGQHRLIFHQAIPVSGTVFSTLTWDAVYDKGDKGAVVKLSCLTRNGAGQILFENRALFLERSAGNFSGNRGPKAVEDLPPQGAAPRFRLAYPTTPQQAALYRLGGDRNPIHIDPDFARRAGFHTPILHGLCTLGIACRAVMTSLCGNHPSRLKEIGGRFTHAVYPGDLLTTEAWESDAPGTHLFRTTQQDGKVVLNFGNAIVT